MAKSLLHLYIDSDLIALAKAKGINMSGEFNDYIKSRLEINEKEGETIQNQIKSLEKELHNHEGITATLRTKIKTLQLQDKKKEEETETKKKEREKIEKKQRETDIMLKRAKEMGITYEKPANKS